MLSYSVDLKTNRVPKEKRAFTLLELAIVLIIVGLLVAGVVGGASLIKSARLRSLMTEFRDWNVVTNAFYVDYDALPGDFPNNIGSLTTAGNADGFVNYVTAGGINEGLLATFQLIESGVANYSLTAPAFTTADTTDTPAAIPGTQILESKYGGGFVMDYIAANAQNVVLFARNFPGVTYAAGTALNADSTSGIINPVDASAIDNKLDDGVANTGSIRAATTATTCSSVGGVYAASTTDAACTLSSQIDVIR